MPKTTNEWLEKRYNLLLKELSEKEFTGDDAKKILVEQSKDEPSSVPVVLSEMKKVGLLEVKIDPKDSRKRIYKLKLQKEVISELTRADIETILKKAADLIRTRVDYKFILILLFLKRISDKWEDETKKAAHELTKEGLSKEQAEKEARKAAYHEFNLPQEYLWDNLRNEVNTLPEKFSHALKTLAELNPELKDILDNADFIQFTSNLENSEILRQLVELFSAQKLHHVSADVLGDAYEWILRYFAPDKAKEGEVYTPREVIRLLVEILKPEPNESEYDPTSASNGMLIIAHKYVEEKHGKAASEKLFLYGQEANPKTLALGRMNMYIHGIRNVHLALGDTLRYPKFKENDKLQQFDIVIANPPWNQDGYDEQVIKSGELWQSRFTYGFVPKQSADWAWIQHMLASSKDKTGRVGVIIDNGCLFRGGKERAIRERVLKADLIEAVLLLPEKLFYNTGAPGAVMFLNKNKPVERKGKILFINASRDFEKHPEVRKLNILAPTNLKKIVDAYDNFKNVEGFSKVVPLNEILDEEKDANLNVSLYVFPEDKQEVIDVDKEWRALHELKKEEEVIDKKIEGYLKEVT